MCPVCGGTGLLQAAPAHTQHQLTYIAWSHAVVIDCWGCRRVR